MQYQVRDMENAALQEYDTIIVGGGIYGITLALEAGRRGKKCLLLERGDFGEYTSFNSLRIIHGGLRYLQSLDLHRFRESVGERSWFLRSFPRQVKPMPCLMPLYGRGLKRPSIFRVALLLNHLLALDRNKDLDDEHQLPVGGILSPEKSRELFSLVDMDGLQGSALWYDAQMENSELLIMELLQLACESGTTAINYCEVQSISTGDGSVTGVSALDREQGKTLSFKANTIINSAGPWAGKLIKGLGGDNEKIYCPSLAWNVIFNRPSLSSHALAVQGKQPGSRALFVTPWRGKIFAGCGHEPWNKSQEKPMPSKAQLLHFIDEVNEAVPGVALKLDDVSRVCCGLLPTIEPGSNVLTKREVLIDHQKKGGPKGLYSIGGIKFTTARLVAEKIWGLIENEKNTKGLPPYSSLLSANNQNAHPAFTPQDQTSMYALGKAAGQNGNVVHLDDLILRRSTLWEQGSSLDLAGIASQFDNWDEQRREEEVQRCLQRLSHLRADLMADESANL